MWWWFALMSLAIAALAYSTVGATLSVAAICVAPVLFVIAAIHQSRLLKRKKQALDTAIDAYEALARRAFD